MVQLSASHTLMFLCNYDKDPYFFAPIHEELKSSEQGIYYLGNINATVRKRNENEFKAGPSIPLIDQAFAEASNGTFDILISDQWEVDGPEFKEAFPVLSQANIEKRILPKFDRDRAQKWWEEN